MAIAAPVDAPQQVEALIDGAQQLAGADRPGPGGRQLDGQRQAVEAGAQLGHVDRVAGWRTGRRRPLVEQLDGRARGQRTEDVDLLAGEADRRPAAGDDGDGGRRRAHGVEHRAHRVEHVLAAVEHDHAALLGEPDRGRVDRLEPEGVGDRGRVGIGRQGGEATRRDRSGQVGDDVSDES